MLTKVDKLAGGDVLIETDADWDCLCIVDVSSYEAYTAGLHRLTGSIIRQMNQERLFAWGCPEGRWLVRFSQRPLPDQPTGFREFTGFIRTTGDLCFGNSDGLGMCPSLPTTVCQTSRTGRFLFRQDVARYEYGSCSVGRGRRSVQATSLRMRRQRASTIGSASFEMRAVRGHTSLASHQRSGLTDDQLPPKKKDRHEASPSFPITAR